MPALAVARFERRLCRRNPVLGGGRKERAVRPATTVGRGAKPPAECDEVPLRDATLRGVVGTLLEVRNLQTHFATRGGVVRAVDGVSWDVR